ncbi:MAG: dienelactone hydrolase family protein [Steroidobacteraceae bacterium]
MGEFTTLMARDGHEFSAYLAPATGAAQGAIVVLQEIFGVNSHIRAVTDGFARQGYVAIAPAFFDRVRRGIELGYGEAQIQEGRGYAMQLATDKVMLDLGAAIAVTRHAGPVAVVGYCWGGTMAYVAACRAPIACAVSYYGARIGEFLGEAPRCPIMYHFGAKDAHIPTEKIDAIRATRPEGEIHVYPAGHGFNCSERGDFDRDSATLALERSLEFIRNNMRRKGKPAASAEDEDE